MRWGVSRESGLAGAAEAARPARRLIQLVDNDRGRLDDFLQDELRDAVAAPYEVRLAAVRVQQDHTDLAAVAGVNQARRVDAGQAVPRRQPAAHHHEAGVADGDRNGDACRDARALARLKPAVDAA